jgi:membrane-bound lytic murein transglycosylase D
MTFLPINPIPYFKHFLLLTLNFLLLIYGHAQIHENTNDVTIQKRLSSIQQKIELPYSPTLLDIIKDRIYPNEEKVAESLSKFQHYKPLFQQEAKKYNMPTEIIYLPYAISMMDHRFKGKFGTSGIWGLTASVAVKFGLRITPNVDERLSVEKSTKAAFAYLNTLYELYGDWWSSIIAFANSPAAYNAAIIRINDPEFTLWDLYHKSRLPIKEIIPNYIFSVYIGQFFSTYNIPTKPYVVPSQTRVRIKKQLNIIDLIDKTEISEQLFYNLNPEFVSQKIPGDSIYNIMLPEIALSKFHLWEDSLYFWGITIREFEILEDSLEASDDDIKDEESVDTSTVAPVAATPVKPTPKPAPKPSPSKEEQRIVYTVKSGDVLGSIAQRHGVSVSKLKEWNNLKSDRIQVGEKLTIIKNQSTTSNRSKSESQQYVYYTVKSGDSLWKIASQFEGVTDEDIRELNKIGNSIHPGQVLKIKVKK